MDKLIGINRLAARLRPLGITRGWLRQEVQSGRLPHLRVGRRVVFNVEAVLEAIAQRAAKFPEAEQEVCCHAG